MNVFIAIKNVIRFFPVVMNYWMHNKDNFDDNLSIAAFVRNEASFLKEWIEYHKLVGVDRFYIYDNYSDDNTIEILDEYIRSGIVIYKLFPGEKKHGIEVQMAAYNDIIKNVRNKTKWLGIIDADEFIVPLKTDDILSSIKLIEGKVKNAQNIPAIGIFWVIFGYDGNENKPDGLVLENYKKSLDKSKLKNIPAAWNWLRDEQVKSIINPRMTYAYTIHDGKFLWDAKRIDELGRELDINKITIECIRVNHYWTKSYQEFKEKCMRNINAFGGSNLEMKYYISGYTPDFLSHKEDFVVGRFVSKIKECMKGMQRN